MDGALAINKTEREKMFCGQINLMEQIKLFSLII